jgi:hypothetical protein
MPEHRAEDLHALDAVRLDPPRHTERVISLQESKQKEERDDHG